MILSIKRIYDDYAAADGYRVLVDRLWPRGISKERAHLDAWNKDIAPSPELRKAFNHEADKWAAFKRDYIRELKANKKAADEFLESVKGQKKVTLLYGAKSPDMNHAVVLRDFLAGRLG